MEKIAHLKERRQVRMFVRRDPYGRYLSCLVYLPRDRYTTAVRQRMEQILLRRLGGASIDYTARVSESVLARLHFVVRMPLGEAVEEEVDVRALERELTQATRSWTDEFADLIADSPDAERLATLVGGLPEGYKEDYTPRQAVQDLAALTALEGDHDMSMALYVPDRGDDEADLRLKIFRRDASMSLSSILPHLTLLGVEVIDERPYELALGPAERAYVYDLGLAVPGGAETVRSRWDAAARQQFMDAFSASYRGLSEPDGFNALVMGADLHWRDVTLLRAIGRYLRQVGVAYSQSYIAQALSANVDLARLLVTHFQTRFDPELPADQTTRAARAAELTEKIKTGLDDVVSLDHDRIIRWFLAVLSGHGPDQLLRLGPAGHRAEAAAPPDAGPARPASGVRDLRLLTPVGGCAPAVRAGGPGRAALVGPGRGLPHRDPGPGQGADGQEHGDRAGRRQGRFLRQAAARPQRRPGGLAGRGRWPATNCSSPACWTSPTTSSTARWCRRRTSSATTGTIRIWWWRPTRAPRPSPTWPTRSRSSSGFWLGDAFASGGSAGYDHKAMGITARGAWVSVQRHFREMGMNPQTDDFTCVGIGDMSGDVFGNGMLLSQHTKLVAAFDHRHILLDPDPDPERSWAERARLFALPRSSWADYDTSLLSAGGGVFPRYRQVGGDHRAGAGCVGPGQGGGRADPG